jgi:hypothetical protein
MDITVPSAVISAAAMFTNAPDVDVPHYAVVDSLRFRATRTSLSAGWVIERIASFEQEYVEAGATVVPRGHLVNVPPFIHNCAYVAVNPLTGRIIGGGDAAVPSLYRTDTYAQALNARNMVNGARVAQHDQ